MSYVCDSHPDQPGTTLLTNLANGDTIVMCQFCQGEVLAAMGEAFTALVEGPPDGAIEGETEPVATEPDGEPVTESASDGTTEPAPADATA